MHVVYTCLSIYIWPMTIFVLFIERSLLQKDKMFIKGTKQSRNSFGDCNTEMGCKGASQ